MRPSRIAKPLNRKPYFNFTRTTNMSMSAASLLSSSVWGDVGAVKKSIQEKIILHLKMAQSNTSRFAHPDVLATRPVPCQACPNSSLLEAPKYVVNSLRSGSGSPLIGLMNRYAFILNATRVIMMKCSGGPRMLTPPYRGKLATGRGGLGVKRSCVMCAIRVQPARR